MSRFSRPKVAVRVWPDRLAFAATEVAIGGPAELQAVLHKLLTLPENAGARLTVLISQRLLHFAVVPWSDALLAPRSAEAYARSAIEATVGESVHSLRITLEDRPRGEPRIACGMDAAWLHAIERAVKDSDARLEWLGPWLAMGWERKRAGFDAGSGWYVAAEREGFSVAAIRHGRLADVAVFQEEATESALARQLNRLALREGIPSALPVVRCDLAEVAA